MLTQSTLLPSLLFHFQKSKTRLSYLEDWPWFYAWILSLRFRVFRHPAGLCDTWQSLNHNDFNCACICKIFTYNILKGLFVRKVDFWVPFQTRQMMTLWINLGLVGCYPSQFLTRWEWDSKNNFLLFSQIAPINQILEGILSLKHISQWRFTLLLWIITTVWDVLVLNHPWEESAC